MVPEDISSESDVTQSSDTSVTESTASSEQSTQEANPQEADSTQSQESLPFNDPKSPMHDRFKELHEQAKSAKAELERERQERAAWQAEIQRQYEQRFQQIQNQFQPKQPETKPFQSVLERLKGIDPEFAQMQEKALEAYQSLPQLTQQLKQLEQQRDALTYSSRMKELFTQHKIPEERQAQYDAWIQSTAAKNPNLRMTDLDKVFTDVHSNLSKHYESIERKIRESYVKEKKSDAVPKTQTGGVSGKKAPEPKVLSKEEYRAYVRDQMVKELRKGNEKI